MLSLSKSCPKAERPGDFKEIMNLHNMTFMATPQHKIPALGVMTFTLKFCKPLLGDHYYVLSLSEQCPGVGKTIFKEIHQFNTFYLKITSPYGVGVMRFTRFCLLSLQVLHFKFGQDWRKCKRKTHDGRQLIAIGHPCDSGELTNFVKKKLCN